ncbi:hypothetical protein BJY00DRAFT_313155 [Aspergillus carlsbadensis]|nr:hypothetical protein BJY00DRAFT_313155 [Aspergillus carlsbadensis]
MSRSLSVASGCIVCRSRKVRCDKTLPSCRNCARLSIPCPGYSTDDRALSRKEIVSSTEKIFRAAGKQRRRMGACQACRASKDQCTRTKPSCQRCTLRKIDCVYRASDKSTSQPVPQDESWPCPTGAVLVVSGVKIETVELYSDALPGGDTLRSLINTYFERIQPTGFANIVHKPSFMKALDCGTILDDFGEPTLHIICALAARLICLDWSRSRRTRPASGPIPGQAWAEKARHHVLLTAHIPTMQDLVAMVLVCEYAIRTHQHALIFTLSGSLFRAICLLGLDAPDQPIARTPTAVLSQETANRIVWASYNIDSVIAPAIDKHSSWRDDYPRIPLPRSDQDFLALNPGTLVSLDLIDTLPNPSGVQAPDVPALTAVLFRLRRTVLNAPTPIWSASSSFSATLLKLDSFYTGLPNRFHLSDLNIYMHRDQNTLGAVLLLHLLFHAAIFDLTRISLPGFSFPLATGFRGAPPAFLHDCQTRCFLHAYEVSKLVRKTLPYKAMIADQPMWAGVVFEASKIQIVFAATVHHNAETHELVKQNLRAHLDLLDFMYTGNEERSPCIRVILSLCMLFGLEDITHEFHGTHLDPDESTFVTGSPEMHHLTNFAFFRQARAEIQARQANLSFTKSPSSKPSQYTPQRALLDAASWEGQKDERENYHPQSNGQISERAAHSISHVPEVEPSLSRSNNLADSQPSVEDYIRTAEGMCDYLAWDSMESWQSWEWPPWETIDPSGLRNQQPNQ